MRLTKESGASVEGCFFALPQSAALKKIIQSEYSPAKCRTSLVERYKNDALEVLSIVMRKLNSVTYEVGKAKAEQASGMFGLTAE